jgi:hypothetical protein
MDPDLIFPEVTTCSLEEIFGVRESKNHKKYVLYRSVLCCAALTACLSAIAQHNFYGADRTCFSPFTDITTITGTARGPALRTGTQTR